MGIDTRQRTTWGNRFRFLLSRHRRDRTPRGRTRVWVDPGRHARSPFWLVGERAGVPRPASRRQQRRPRRIGESRGLDGCVRRRGCGAGTRGGTARSARSRRRAANSGRHGCHRGHGRRGRTARARQRLFVHPSHRFGLHARPAFHAAPVLAADLGKLRANAPTTIVVLQKHRMFGTLTDERDSYTKAAEEKVTEKVKDLVDEFRRFGPQFNVAVLDTEAFGYKDRLDEADARRRRNSRPRLKPRRKTASSSRPTNMCSGWHSTTSCNSTRLPAANTAAARPTSC